MPTVLVQGAGPAGITLALALKRRGVKVDIIDRAPADRNDGYVVGLRHNGLRAMQALGLRDAMMARRIPLAEAAYCRANGKPFVQFDYQSMMQAAAGGMIAILRADIMTVLKEQAAIEGLQIAYDRSISDIVQDSTGADVVLTNGQTARYDLVVGTDGYRSGVRRFVFGPDSGFSRELGYRVAAWRYTPGIELTQSASGVSEVHRQATVYALPDGTAETLFCWRDDDISRHDAAQKQATAKRLFGTYPNPIRDAIEQCKSWEDSFADTLSLVELPKWSKDRTVLLGDAAWSMALISGEGPSTAMAGALVLAEELTNKPVNAALEAFDNRLRPTVAQIQKKAAAVGGQFVPTSRIAMALQRIMLPMMMTPSRLPRLVQRMQAPDIAFAPLPPEPAK